MRKPGTLILAALAAAMLFTLAAGGASARSFSVSERNFELTWNANLTGKTQFTFRDAAGHHVECNVTLLGSFLESTFAKETGARRGTIEHGEVAECRNGTLELREFPWQLFYRSFEGALPTITGISVNVIGASFRWVESSSGLSCLVSSEARIPLTLIIDSFSGRSPEDARAEEASIPLAGFICGFVSPGRFSGTSLIRSMPPKLTITLI